MYINALIIKKRVSEWSDDDIASVLTLRSLSPRCYRYLRLQKHWPLPCETTLKESARRFYCEPGILSAVLQLMHSKGDSVSPLEKLTVISFDEMFIKKEWSYDKAMDVFYKPYERVQVVMLRGLVGRWKQPIH